MNFDTYNMIAVENHATKASGIYKDCTVSHMLLCAQKNSNSRFGSEVLKRPAVQ